MMFLAHTADAEGTGALPWQGSFTARLEALALLQTLNAEHLSRDSATLTLDRWCAAHRLASPARIVAKRAAGAEQAPTDEQRQLLGISATEPVRYRRVRLICGDHVLSEADNWYVPARLTPEMNRLLDTTDIAFGRAVQTLNFRRRTLSAKLLWPPLPQDWEMGAPLSERRRSQSPTACCSTALCFPCRTAHHSARWSRPTLARWLPSQSRHGPSTSGR
jgi:hypothetical protein